MSTDKLIVGLNPAWQQTLVFANVKENSVNRANQALQFASGKGVNALRALRCIDEKATVLQVVGGTAGEGIVHYIETQKCPHLTVKSETDTRICTTVINQNSSAVTELIGKSEPIAMTAFSRLNQTINKLGNYQAVLISGTTYAGTDESLYNKIIKKCNSAFIIVDSCKGLDKTLKDVTVDVLKINSDELKELTSKENIKEGIAELKARFDIKIIIITNGKRPVTIATDRHMYELVLPVLRRTLNPIGAGDTSAAMLLAEFSRLKPASDDAVLEACRRAFAAASASCFTFIPGQFDLKTAKEVSEQIFTLQLN
jgi:fructose-1-phosphate kinase PfkB-like protein